MKLSSPDLSVASICGTRVSEDMRAFGPHQCGIFRGTSLRVRLGYLFAGGPALALVLHLPLKCGGRTPGLEFRCRIVSRGEGYRVSWVPLGFERVACMTAAYLETSNRNLSNEVVLIIVLTLCQFGVCGGIPLLSPRL